MKREFLNAYVAPNVVLLNISIERGFAISGPSDFLDPDYEGRYEE
jgi:hypothetical protein